MLLPLLVACHSDPSPPGDDDDTVPPTASTGHTGGTTDSESTPPTADCPAVLGLEEVEGSLLLERRLTARLDGADAAWLACTSSDDPLERHLLESDGPADTHAFVLRGLLADTTYTCRAHAACGGPAAEVTFTTGVPTELPQLTSTRVPGEEPWGAYTLYNQQRGCAPAQPMRLAITDVDGRLRWFYEIGTDLLLDVDAQLVDPDTIHLGGGWGLFDERQSNRGVFRDIDLSGATLLDRALPDFGLGFNHHSERLADGTYLSITGDRDTNGRREWNGVGVELWSPAGGVVWSWDSRALALAGEVDPPGVVDVLILPSPYHANAAALLTDTGGDALWLSIYGTRQLWRIDRATGERTHVFGAVGDFTLVDLAGDPLPDREYPWVQHGPDYLPDGHVLVYDNGLGRPGGEGSRVAEYLLDLAQNRATLLWSWTEPGWSATVVGDADYLPNGHVLVTQGFAMCAELVDDDVSEIVELRPPDTVVARLTWPDKTWGVYRSQRYAGCDVFANARFCDALSARWDELHAP